MGESRPRHAKERGHRKNQPPDQGAPILTLGFQPPELWLVNVCGLSHPSVILCGGSPSTNTGSQDEEKGPG